MGKIDLKRNAANIKGVTEVRDVCFYECVQNQVRYTHIRNLGFMNDFDTCFN